MYKGDGNMASLREVSVTLQARWKEPASIESNVFVKNGCIISRWLLQSRFARQLPPGGSPLFRSRVFFIKLYLCKITTAIFEIDFVSKLRLFAMKSLFCFFADGFYTNLSPKALGFSPAKMVFAFST